MRYTGNSTNETITAANLSGNGNYIMNTDLQASYDSKDVQSNGDKIIITTSSTGNNILDLRDVSLDKKLASQGYLLLVEDRSNGGATFTGKDLDHGGIFRYRPVITTTNPTDYSSFNASAKNWYLTGFEKLIEVSDNTKATLGLSGTRYANYFMDNDTLLKRLGELRGLKGEPEQDGIWARYRHGGMDGDGFSGGSSMVQVGYDKKTSNKRYTGLAFNHTSNTYDFDGGATGEGSQDALTVYNTWLGDKNHYFDIVGKIGKMRGNSTYIDSLYPEKGHYDSWYCSISGEYGRKNIDRNGWYYEPQAQLTLGRIRGNDYTTGLGTRVNMASITSLISRAGVTFGKEYNMKDANTHSNIYGKINWLHEFKGDVHTGLLDTYGDSYDHEKDYGGSWWNAGIGATINVNKNTHMYLDFEKNFGGEVTTNWIGQLGCQWTWK
jgi:outer membrane autotransporter protein